MSIRNEAVDARQEVESTRGTMWARVGLERASLEIQAASLGLLANRVRACRWRRRRRQAFAFSSAITVDRCAACSPIQQKLPVTLSCSVSPADARLINSVLPPQSFTAPLHRCAASRRTRRLSHTIRPNFCQTITDDKVALLRDCIPVPSAPTLLVALKPLRRRGQAHI